ncbi:hypothetical protein PLESTM_001913000 [Pleodorina starrii]|nr:hypothetical protein PLESTM_001913000 [Pleodorina starrii]
MPGLVAQVMAGGGLGGSGDGGAGLVAQVMAGLVAQVMAAPGLVAQVMAAAPGLVAQVMAAAGLVAQVMAVPGLVAQAWRRGLVAQWGGDGRAWWLRLGGSDDGGGLGGSGDGGALGLVAVPGLVAQVMAVPGLVAQVMAVPGLVAQVMAGAGLGDGAAGDGRVAQVMAGGLGGVQVMAAPGLMAQVRAEGLGQVVACRGCGGSRRRDAEGWWTWQGMAAPAWWLRRRRRCRAWEVMAGHGLGGAGAGLVAQAAAGVVPEGLERAWGRAGDGGAGLVGSGDGGRAGGCW